MSRLETTSFKLGANMYLSDKHIVRDDFLNMTMEHLLINHHRRNGKITSFYLIDSDSNNHICFLISEDTQLNKKLNMIDPRKISSPDKSYELFPQETYQYENIKLLNLCKNLDNENADFQLHVDNMHYCFRLSVGQEAIKTDKKIVNYIDEVLEADFVAYSNNTKLKM